VSGSLEIPNLRESPHVTRLAHRRIEKRVDNSHSFAGGDDRGAERQDVGASVLTRVSRECLVGAHGCPDSLDLVGRDSGTEAGPVDHNPRFGFSPRDLKRNRGCRIRIVDGLAGIRPEIVHGEAAASQMLDERFLEREAGVIVCDRHRTNRARRRESLGVYVGAFANHRDAAALQGVSCQRCHVSSSDEHDGAPVVEHTSVGFTYQLESLHQNDGYVTLGCNHLNILIPEHDIQKRVREIASDIHRDHPDGVHLIAVLKGAFVFLSDLARAMPGRCSIDFMAVSSYGKGSTSSGQVQLLKDLDSGIEGRDVVIIEDIVDTGLTLTYLQDILRARSPRSLRTACLLSKPSRRLVDVTVDYVGFSIEDRFVVGYGLDYAEQHRNLPYIAALDGDK
jgi:hypoxanthine phosphoribosyltransferase